MVPETVEMSVQTGTPAGTPTWTSPEAPRRSSGRGGRGDDQVAAAGGHRDVGPGVADRTSPDPVLTTTGPRVRQSWTSPEPVETARVADASVTRTSPEPLLIRRSPRFLEAYAAGAGLDGQRTVDGVDLDVARAALDLAAGHGAGDGHVGAPGLTASWLAVGRVTVTSSRLSGAEEAGPAWAR